MLRFMRRHASRWVLGGLLAIIIVTFVFGFGFSRNSGDKSVAQVGHYKVSAVEYWEAYKKTENYYRMLYRDKFDEATRNELKLKETVMDQLVDKYLLLTKAQDMGLSVSEREIAESLSAVDFFKRNGKFSRQAYLNFLRQNNLNPNQFEQDQRQSMIINKMISIIQDNGGQVDDKAAYESFVKEKGQVKLSIAVFDPEDYKGKVTVDEKEVAAIYEREKGTYRSENTWHLKYLVIDEKSEIRDDQAYMELLKTKDMTEFGKSKSIQVVDTGTVKESDLLQKFSKLNIREALKGMGKGDISLPIRDGGVSYLFQIVDREDGKPFEKSEALKVIAARVAGEKARMMARVKAEDGVKDRGIKFAKETEFISRKSASIPGLGEIPKDSADVLGLTKGQTYQKPVEINGRYYVFAFVDEKQPDQSEWEKGKEAYKRFFAATTRSTYLTALKEDMKKTVKVKINWDVL
jgi:hypothetical protein